MRNLIFPALMYLQNNECFVIWFQVRHLLLEDAIQLFSFFWECDDFANWMKEREKILSSNAGSGVDTVEETKRKFEVML